MRRTPDTPSLKTVVIYDDTRAGQRGMRALERLEQERGIRLSLALWRFDLLAAILHRCRATDDVLDAELVVISLSQPDEVPKPIAHWLDAAIARKRQRRTDGLGLQCEDEVMVVPIRGSLDGPAPEGSLS